MAITVKKNKNIFDNFGDFLGDTGKNLGSFFNDTGRNINRTFTPPPQPIQRPTIQRPQRFMLPGQDIFENVGNFVKDTIVAPTVNQATNTIGNVNSIIDAQNKSRVQEMVNKGANEAMKKINEDAYAGRITWDEASRRSRVVTDAVQKSGINQQASDATRKMSNIDPVKAAGDAAGTFLTLATLGNGKVVLDALGKPIVKSLGQRVVQNTASNALLGAGFGGLSVASQQGVKATPQDYLQGAGTGALVGGGLGLGGTLAGPALKVGAKKLEAMGKPTNLTEAELASARKVVAQNSGMGDQKLTTGDMLNFRKAEVKLKQRPGTPDGMQAVNDALKAHMTYDMKKRQGQIGSIKVPGGKQELPQVGIKGIPKVSTKGLTYHERAIGDVLGMTKEQVAQAKAIHNGTIDVHDLIQRSGLTPDDLANLGSKDQTLLAKYDKTFLEAKAPSITVTSRKAPEAQALMQDLSRATQGSGIRGELVTSKVSSMAKDLGVNIDEGFIRRYQKGMLKGDAEKQMGKFIRETITDPTFKIQQVIDPTIKHRKNYVPQTYAQDGGAVAEAMRRMNTKTKSSAPRSFTTYEEAAQYGLTPKHSTLDKMLGENVTTADRALGSRKIIDNGLKNGIFSTSTRSGVPVQGFLDTNGKQIYAAKEIADTINSTLQTNSTLLGRGLHKTAEAASIAQDVMLQGGIPGTNFNFFVAGQAVKDTTRNIGKSIIHPIQAVKQEGNLLGDLFRGKTATQARFAENSKFVRELSDHGLNITHQSNLFNEGKSGARQAWNTLGNNPTFGRYQPNRMLSTAQEVYQQSVKKLGHEKAIKLAADTTKTFNGLVDHVAKGESKMTQDAKSILFFAPKYRESIINALGNTAKSLDPRTMKTFGGSGKYQASRELLTGMGVTLAAYELLNRKLTGHSMFENRQGQELSLEIPYGEKDAKGNQPVINIPFMPGFMTIPRAIAGAGVAASKGDVRGVVKEASKMSSAPIQIGGNVLANRDYFDRPIYNDEQVASNEGVVPDNPLQAVIKIGAYVGGQLSPAWNRGIIGWVQGKPLEQNIAVALEAPVRFGKHLNPATEAYFKDRDQIYASLDQHSKDAFDTIHPKLKNVNGDYVVDKTVDSGLARASNYLDNPAVLAADNEMAKRAKARGEAVDPLFSLTGEQQRIALRMDTLPPKDPNKTVLRAQNSWYQPYLDERAKFFDSLPPGDPNKPKGPITYPEPSAQVAALQDAYYQLTDSTMKREMLKNNPEIVDQFAKEEQYSRAVRAAKNLPQYDKYPEPTKEVQNLIDFYMSIPKGDGPGGKSTSRSNWIKAHPNEWAKMSDQFDKQSIYNLQQDMSIAAFEGQDPTDKGIKAIASLGGGSSGGGGGYGGGKKTDPTLNPRKYAVSLSAGGKAPAAIKSKVKLAALGKAKVGRKSNNPKVSIKNSKV